MNIKTLKKGDYMKNTIKIEMATPEYFDEIKDIKSDISIEKLRETIQKADRQPQVITTNGEVYDLTELNYQSLKSVINNDISEPIQCSEGFILLVAENGFNRKLPYNAIASNLINYPLVGNVVLTRKKYLRSIMKIK
jgi:hypothetical protein